MNNTLVNVYKQIIVAEVTAVIIHYLALLLSNNINLCN